MVARVSRPCRASTPVLERDPALGMVLRQGDQVLRADFEAMLPRLRPNNLRRELLVRAARVKGTGAATPTGATLGAASPAPGAASPAPTATTQAGAKPVATLGVAGALTAVDATAGLGEDALLLAAAGFVVTLFERDPTIATLLRDALDRAQEVPALQETVARMTLVEGDSIQGLAALPFTPDVVFLDPMFPTRRKSAAVKKKLQLIQLLEKPCEDEQTLMAAACATGARKVIVKRPVKGPWLADVKPAYSLSGKAVRYDVVVPASKLC